MTNNHEITAGAGQVSVGSRIRALRKIRGVSLQQMSQETGMSYSYLSGLENDKHSVSITNLQRVANFFSVDMVYFLMPSGHISRVFRKKELFDQSDKYENIIYRVVTPEDSTNLQVSYVHMNSHEPSERNIHKHGKGQEMILVLEGCVHVMIEEERYIVEQGDSIFFEADVEHLIYTEDETATFVIISSPPYGQNIKP
jgi:transcriptional regulator with XRE-family HTH domain